MAPVRGLIEGGCMPNLEKGTRTVMAALVHGTAQIDAVERALRALEEQLFGPEPRNAKDPISMPSFNVMSAANDLEVRIEDVHSRLQTILQRIGQATEPAMPAIPIPMGQLR